MMTIALVNEFLGERFETVEDAVIAINEKGLEFADIDIYAVDEDGCIITWLDTISVSSEDNYTFYMYSVSPEGVDIGNMYNTAEEIYDMKNTLNPGKYEICRVTQTVTHNLYIDITDTFEIAE